ncbi:helix-turn-helix domain-containing protein [Tomitella gaofuii]|uniref:helix-turn-helix domain-containing protein n=1 Tax=Tomitella gaofuii TaxID=2760083 RepID=UPI0015F8B107|nr:helix-turn-helix domain-containing protein [Tomitella gaofuii]
MSESSRAAAPTSNTTAVAAEYVSIATAAELTDCSIRTMRRLIASGELRARRVGPRMLRISRAELDRVFAPAS